MSNNFSPFSNTMNPHIQQVKYDYDPVVIKPPNRNVTHGTITKQIVIEMAGTVRQIHIENENLKAEVSRLLKEIQLLETKIKK